MSEPRFILSKFLGNGENSPSYHFLRVTRAGTGYFMVWLGLMATGLYAQNNLILLMSGLAAGPIAASFVMSSGMLRKLSVNRRAPETVFANDPLALQYTLENPRRLSAALAVELLDEFRATDRLRSGAERVRPQVEFERVEAGTNARLRWIGTAPTRGRYQFGNLSLVTRAPFGLMERRISFEAPWSMIVYPQLGRLTRNWQKQMRAALQTRRGSRHDRTAQQQEYHGLREYRSGDSPRWIHWRTSARTGELMVKEFEQEKDQLLALLLDPWVPEGPNHANHETAVELMVRFAATVCVETCRQPGRRLLLAWTGPSSGIRHGPASSRLMHELLTTLSTLQSTASGQVSALMETIPPAMVRDSTIVLVTTRPIDLNAESQRSTKIADGHLREFTSRLLILNARNGDLTPYFEHHGPTDSNYSTFAAFPS